MLRQYQLGPRAIDYIRGRLSEGRTLSKLLLHLNMEAGTAWSYLPAGIDDETAHDLTRGVVAPLDPKAGHRTGTGIMIPVPTPSRPLILEMIRQFLLAHSGACCIFEHALARATDQWLAHETGYAPYLTFDDEVYFFLSGRDRSVDDSRIGVVMDRAQSYLLTGILTIAPEGFGPLRFRQIVTFDQLRALADSVQAIILGAYDGQGYIIWSRS